MRTMVRSTMLAALAAFTLASTPADAYFELELVSGGTMVADSYVEEGDAYRLYRPGGELRIDKERVAAIHEREGRLNVPAPTAPETVAAPAAPAARAEEAPAVASAEPLPQSTAELEALERNLTRDIILGHREALFAKNRGEDEDALKQRKKEIKRLEDRREQVQSRLGPR